MTIPGLPPELSELLERLQRRGLVLTPLEVTRLRHLCAVDAIGCPQHLLPLLSAILCKDQRQRTLLQREYSRWLADHERAFEPLQKTAPIDGAVAPSRLAADLLHGSPHTLPAGDETAAGRLRPLDWRNPKSYLRFGSAAAMLLALVLGIAWLLPEPPATPVTRPSPVSTSPAAAAKTLAEALCLQDLPTEPAPQVWAWVPRPDYRPWLALGGGLLLLLTAVGAGWRLVRAKGRYLGGLHAEVGAGSAPVRGLAPLAVHGNLLLEPEQQREMVWAIDRYVSQDPARELDPMATVDATARAGGEPRIVQRRLSFPREVWLWCDRKSSDQALQLRLVQEVRNALQQANLPVRIAHFNGLPQQLRWEENREPFLPACTEAAGAQAAVALISDGAAMLQAWDSPGERPRLQQQLRELRVWPRLCLVDLGKEQELIQQAPEWHLDARGGAGLAAWLAGRAPEKAIGADSDQAQLDLWVAAWLLADLPPEHTAAQALRHAMRLQLQPLAYPLFLARLEASTSDRKLADRLVNRLARSQRLDAKGYPQEDGWFTRALDFWEERYHDSIQALPEDDAESRARLQTGLAALRLWRNPEEAAKSLLRLQRGRRNALLINRALGRLAPAAGNQQEEIASAQARRPTWDWQQLSRRAQVRLLHLGLYSKQWDLHLGAGHHLVLALLLGTALAGMLWGTARVLTPQAGGHPVFQEPRFLASVIRAEWGRSAWLGSPWSLTLLPAFGPFATPFTWSWQPQNNPQLLAPNAGIFISGRQAFPIRGCDKGWPRRSLAAIQAPLDNPGARKLAMRLLDRGAADRVLVAPDWAERLPDLTQGLPLADDQLLLFLPTGGHETKLTLPGAAAHAVIVRGQPAALAQALDFHGVREPAQVWSETQVLILAGEPKVRGEPSIQIDEKTGVTWVQVCGGSFSMGSPAEERNYLDEYARDTVSSKADVERWLSLELPRHPVLLEDFWITRSELTRGQYRALGKRAEGEADLPLGDVDWAQARTACEALPLISGTGAEDWRTHLATEAQWEYAARAGSAERWSFGDNPATLDDYAWYRENGENKPHQVGAKRPNAHCLVDMHGNLFEWTQDCFRADEYASRGAPLVLEPLADAGDCDRRVVRGGSFVSPPVVLRSADRADGVPDVRNENLGLRCVRSRVRQP